MTELLEGPSRLRKGANVSLTELGVELDDLTVYLDTRGSEGVDIDADVSVLLLDATGQVRSSADFVFYNQPVAPGGVVRLRDKVAQDQDTADGQAGWASDVITVALADVPDEVERIVVAASLDPSLGQTFGAAEAIRLRLQRTADAVDLLTYDIDDASTELALLFGEFYRRNGDWKLRAVGQGYDDGLEGLVRAHGVEVDGPDEAGPSDCTTSEESSADVVAAVGPDVVPDVTEQAEPAPLKREGKRGVSVRRPVRAPRLPADWNAPTPESDGPDWQAARLFPVAGIGSGDEQERRATSALLAVMGSVREFGAALTAPYGAPRGTMEAFIEVPFGQDEDACRPDGLLRITRGQKSWTALVEVKTSNGKLEAKQIDQYVEIARSKGFDAVITISNELTGGDADHPVAIDRRKLRKIALHHLSWDQIRAQAVLTARHRGVADATQGLILEEFIRYMNHPRSGMGGMGDMGPDWVKVRTAVKAKTARPNDKSIGEVSARFDQLAQHLAHHMSGLLGVEVQALTPRETPDHAGRRQQLADSGLLFGRIKVPGAIAAMVLEADLRSDKVSASVTVPAPNGDMRPQTKVTWLLRQIPEDAKDSIRIEAHLSGPRAQSTAALLGKLRDDPKLLIPVEQREIKSFTVSLEAQLGAKRAAGPGTLIGSAKDVALGFYGSVVQHLRPWSDKRAAGTTGSDPDAS